MSLPITKLDLPEQVDGILASYADRIRNAIVADKQNNTKLEQSKVIGECSNKIRYEIQRQGKIYTDEETQAVKWVVAMHELTKTQAKAAEGHVQTLAKKWDEKLAQLINSIADVIADKAKQAVELKANMVGHQAFRAGFCSQKECTELLGEGTYNTLNKTYLAIREPPMRAWMTSQELLTKIGEHAKRTAQYVSMLPALLKKAEKDTSKSEGELKSMIGQIQQDAKAVSDAKNGKLFAPATVNKIKNVEKDLKAPKLDEKGWKKLEIFVLGYERDLKQRNSELKTLGILLSSAPKKAGVYAQDTTIKNLIKQMDTDVKEMTKLAADIEKETLAVRKVYDQIGKQFK